MGTIQIKKVKKTVTTGKQGEVRQKVKKIQSKKSLYKASAMKNETKLSTSLYEELNGSLTPNNPSPNSPEGEGSGSGSNENQNQNENGGGSGAGDDAE